MVDKAEAGAQGFEAWLIAMFMMLGIAYILVCPLAGEEG